MSRPVTVIWICPGDMVERWAQAMSDAAEAEYVREVVLGSLITPGECGRCWLERTSPKKSAPVGRRRRKAPRAKAPVKKQSTMGFENASFALAVQDAPEGSGPFVEPVVDTQVSMFGERTS